MARRPTHPELEPLREERDAIRIAIHVMTERGTPANEIRAQQDKLSTINARIYLLERHAG